MQTPKPFRRPRWALVRLLPTPSASAAEQIADALLLRKIDRSGNGSVSPATDQRTVQETLSKIRNKYSISGTTGTVTDIDDSTELYTEELTTAAVNPVTGWDPT